MKRMSTQERGEFLSAVNGKDVAEARQYAEEHLGWKYKPGKQNLTRDERFAGWFESQRQKFICELVADKLIRDGEFSDEETYRDAFAAAKKAGETSGEFYFLRDNLGQKELLKQAENVAPNIKTPEAEKQADLASAFEKLGIRL